MTRKKVCLTLCYWDTEYVRGKAFQKALSTLAIDSDIELVIVKNTHRGILRYFEVIAKLIRTRLTTNPDIYLISFRGYEILPFVLLIGVGKKVIYDEFINPVEWAVYEHKKADQDSLVVKILKSLYKFLLMRTAKILSDTKSHAAYSAKIMHIPVSKYAVLPVGTDEDVFKPLKESRHRRKFQVLYYGSMLPLHGVEYVIESAVKLGKNKDIEFLIIGGSKKLRDDILVANSKGAHITYKKWVNYHKLPDVINDADLCLAGPFGGTVQSQFVITGKTYQFLAMGKAAVVGETKESGIFENRHNILIAKQTSSSSLRATIKWAFDNRESLYDIGKNGRNIYNECYSDKANAKRLQLILDSLD
ncbi:MAG: glycosyltransferase [Candidatus Nomurabacteria bacterium]|nr:MAG: glycosyltransferase [Candidatus Nomurabacteria bacterium]